MPPEAAEAEESLRDTIAAAMTNSGSSDGDSGTVDVSASAESSAPKDAAQKNVSPAPAAAKEAAPAGGEATKKDAATAAAAPTRYDPPARWTKEEKEGFSALDPAVQKLLLGRNKSLEGNYTRKMMEVAQERERFAGLESILAPRRNDWTSRGVSDAQALNYVFSQWDLAQRDPRGFIQRFAQEKGLDLASMFAPQHRAAQPSNGDPGAQGQPQGQPQVHPAFAHRLQTIEQQLGGIATHLNGRAAQESQHTAAAARSEIDTFKNAVDSSTGEPLYPFFDDVIADMASLMKNGIAGTLEEAYTKACRLNDSVATRLRESEEVKRKRQDEERRAAEAERSRRAGSSLSPSASGGAHRPAASDDDNDDSIRGLLLKGFSNARNVDARI